MSDIEQSEASIPGPQKSVGTAAKRRSRKKYQGKVIADKMDKTITVVVERLVRHALYEKFIRKRAKMHAHDEKNEAKVGDTVEIMASRPLSKLKRFSLVRILAKADQ